MRTGSTSPTALRRREGDGLTEAAAQELSGA